MPARFSNLRSELDKRDRRDRMWSRAGHAALFASGFLIGVAYAGASDLATVCAQIGGAAW